jgi:hypothetical protein
MSSVVIELNGTFKSHAYRQSSRIYIYMYVSIFKEISILIEKILQHHGF